MGAVLLLLWIVEVEHPQSETVLGEISWTVREAACQPFAVETASLVPPSFPSSWHSSSRPWGPAYP